MPRYPAVLDRLPPAALNPQKTIAAALGLLHEQLHQLAWEDKISAGLGTLETEVSQPFRGLALDDHHPIVPLDSY